MPGKPRKLKEVGTEEATSVDSTVTVHVEGEIIPQTVTVGSKSETDVRISSSRYLPYRGKDSLTPGVPQYFVNGKKLLRIIKTQHGTDSEGNAVYKISRTLFRFINDKPQGKALRAQLKKMDIPGA